MRTVFFLNSNNFTSIIFFYKCHLCFIILHQFINLMLMRLLIWALLLAKMVLQWRCLHPVSNSINYSYMVVVFTMENAPRIKDISNAVFFGYRLEMSHTFISFYTPILGGSPMSFLVRYVTSYDCHCDSSYRFGLWCVDRGATFWITFITFVLFQL